MLSFALIGIAINSMKENCTWVCCMHVETFDVTLTVLNKFPLVRSRWTHSIYPIYGFRATKRTLVVSVSHWCCAAWVDRSSADTSWTKRTFTSKIAYFAINIINFLDLCRNNKDWKDIFVYLFIYFYSFF